MALHSITILVIKFIYFNKNCVLVDLYNYNKPFFKALKCTEEAVKVLPLGKGVYLHTFSLNVQVLVGH